MCLLANLRVLLFLLLFVFFFGSLDVIRGKRRLIDSKTNIISCKVSHFLNRQRHLEPMIVFKMHVRLIVAYLLRLKKKKGYWRQQLKKQSKRNNVQQLTQNGKI